MKETIKEAKTQSVQSPKFKGRTTIILRNAETNEIENKIVEENMVTNAISTIFSSNYCGQLDYAALMPIATKTLGGVLCWASPIEENANNIYPPTTSTNALTAHAGQTTYIAAGDDNKRGNPNSIVSGKTTTGYSNTWDFAQTQANGTISCITLTHADFGDFFLNGGANFKPVDTVSLMRTEYKASDENGQLNSRYIYDDSRSLAYGFYINGTSLKLRKHKHFNTISQDVTSTFPTSGDYTDTTITLGHSHSSNSCYLFNSDANTLTLIIPKSNGSNILYRDVINLSSNAVSSDELTISGASFKSVNYGSRYCFNELTKSGRLYLPSTSNTFYGIKYNQPSDTIETTNVGNYAINLDYTGYAVNGDYIAVGNSIIEGDKNYMTTRLADGWSEYYVAVGVKDSPVKASNYYYRYNQNNDIGCPVLNKMYIGTINNLETPVTKTSSQTMTITYELIQES